MQKTNKQKATIISPSHFWPKTFKKAMTTAFKKRTTHQNSML